MSYIVHARQHSLEPTPPLKCQLTIHLLQTGLTRENVFLAGAYQTFHYKSMWAKHMLLPLNKPHFPQLTKS